MNTAAIASHLNVIESAIVRVEEWAKVLFVVVKGVGARFVSKKVVVMSSPVEVEFILSDSPSKSKGWGRYQVTKNGEIMEAPRGGNWISGKAYKIEATENDVITIQGQCQLMEGQLKTRTTYSDQPLRLMVKHNASTEYRYYPGSQGLCVKINNAN